MKHSFISLFIAAFIVGLPMGLALAADPHTGTTGQPNKSCEEVPDSARPGNAFRRSGSAFNPDGTASGVYANAGADPPGGNNSTKPPSTAHVPLNATSQYDVACFQQLP